MSPLMYSLAENAITYKSEVYTPQVVEPKMTPKNVVDAEDVKSLIAYHFEGEDAKIAYAIVRAESSGNSRAIGYNCYYTKDGLVHETRVQGAYSTHCRKGHETYSWSIDCGKIQRNYPGIKECPEYTFAPKWSIAEMKRLHDKRGWQPWVAYTSGKYLAYIE